MGVFKKSRLTEAFEAVLRKNDELAREKEALEAIAAQLRAHVAELEDKLMVAQGNLEGAEEIAAQWLDRLREAERREADLQAESVAQQHKLANMEEVLDALAWELENTAQTSENNEELLYAYWADWKNTAKEREKWQAVEADNYRLWVENTLLRAQLALMDAKNAYEIAGYGVSA